MRRLADDGQRPIRVLVAEDEEPLRAAICDLIADEADLELAGVAADADAAIEQARVVRPDVALLDMRMPAGGGPRAAREIRVVSPGTRSIALSAYDDRSNVLEMLRSGAIGYLVKGASSREIVEAIRRAARDQASLSGVAVSALVGELTRDLAERDEANEALKRNEARFQGLVESTPDAVAIVEADGRILLVNKQTERLFGYTRTELLGRPIELLLPERFRERHTGHRAARLLDSHPRSFGVGLQLAGLRKDGSEFPVDIALSAIETYEGELTTAFIRDLSGDEPAGIALPKNEERFEALLESAPDAVVIVDTHGQIVLVNGQTERIFGYSRNELLGNPIEVLLPDRFHERHVRHRDGYLAAPRTRPMGVGLELAGRRKDGTEFPVDISLSAIVTDEGLLAAAFVRDVTEREARVDLAARRAVLGHIVSAGEEERRRIAADIHDDSIQVMTAAGMRLQILRRSLDNPEQLARLDDLEQTIQLAISRLRHLLFELRPPVLDHEGLGPALRMYLDQAGGEPGTSYRLDDRLTSQPSEATRVILYRIAQEVLTNVRKHADADNVTVTLAGREGGYYVQVVDDGAGFTPDVDTPRPGHLGLAAIRERAELAGGWLRVESTPGQGTTVEVWITHGIDSDRGESELGRPA